MTNGSRGSSARRRYGLEVSDGGGIETYFNHPEALNVTEAIPVGRALGARLFGIVVNGIARAILAMLGYGLGGFLPEK